MKRTVIAAMVIGSAVLGYGILDTSAQAPGIFQARQIRIGDDGVILSWGTVTTGPAGGAGIRFGTAYANPPTVVLTGNAVDARPASSAGFGGVAYGIKPGSFGIKTDAPNVTVSFIAIGGTKK